MVDIFPSLSYFLGRFWSSSVCTLCLPICWVQCLPGWLSSSSSSSVCCQRSFWWSFASPEAPIHDRYTHPSPFPLWILPFYHIHPILCYSPDLLTLLFFFHLTPCPNQAWRDSVTANKKIFDVVRLCEAGFGTSVGRKMSLSGWFAQKLIYMKER